MIPAINSQEPVAMRQVPDSYTLSISTDLLNEEHFIETTYFLQTIPILFSNKHKVFNHLYHFIQIQNGWDGGDAIAPYIESISNSLKFLYRIPTDFIEKIDIENIYPTNHGTIVIDLINENGDKVSLEFGKTKMGFFSDFKDGLNSRIESTIFNYNNLPSNLLSAVTKLYQSYIF